MVRPAGVLPCTLLLLALTIPAAAQERTAAGAGATVLEVPYLPQTEALCGGAAAAMLFRYWGERHAGVEPFEALVDRAAGGIADVVLVEAIRHRQWRAERIEGSIDAVRTELRSGRPPMILIEDRPRRYHYVVVVGADAAGVLVHDPAWGPSRRLAMASLQKAWEPTGRWMLRVTPGNHIEQAQPAIAITPPDRPASRCDLLLEDTLDEIAGQGLGRATALLERARAECPHDAGPVRELAAVQFAQGNWAEAAHLSEEALRRQPGDAYAADVLGSSRFLLNDTDGALRAWNRIDRPQLDSVRITGLTRTRYSVVADALGLSSSGLISDDRFRLAQRRLESLPDQTSTRLSLRPDRDGFAVVDVAVVERARVPSGTVAWSATAARSLLEREIALTVPGRSGLGEVWSAAWGWWENRPRVALAFAAPQTSWLRGVWHVHAAWERQTYGLAAQREERLGGHVAVGDWLTPNLRAELTVGADSWTRTAGRVDRTVQAGGSIERRLLRDRAAVTLSGTRYSGLAGAPAFSAATVTATFRTRRDPEGLVVIARAGASATTREAPLALSSGAGEGRARTPLLRAHRQLDDGRIVGPVFGRRMAHLTIEAQRWSTRPRLVRLGAAVFADSAVAGARPAFAVTGSPFQMDVGAGLRIRIPGRNGLFRIDYARGLRDKADALIAAWQVVD